MLLSRLLTAIVLIPLVVGGILYLPSQILALVIGAFILIGAREWSLLSGFKAVVAQLGFAVLVAAALALMFFVVQAGQHVLMQMLAALAWSLATVLLVLRRQPLQPVIGQRPGVLLLGVLVLAIAWMSIVLLHQQAERGPQLVLFLFVLIWTADSGAYFAGRAFGKHKLSPHVSPGKTWEGVAGAMLGALVCALVLDQLQLVGLPPLPLIGLCLLVTAVSIGGDLLESVLKRQAQMKDSGNLLPGHGGALDRIDSLLAAAPVFVIGLSLLEQAA